VTIANCQCAIEFLKQNYDIKYRLGRESEEEE